MNNSFYLYNIMAGLLQELDTLLNRKNNIELLFNLINDKVQITKMSVGTVIKLFIKDKLDNKKYNIKLKLAKIDLKHNKTILIEKMDDDILLYVYCTLSPKEKEILLSNKHLLEKINNLIIKENNNNNSAYANIENELNNVLSINQVKEMIIDNIKLDNNFFYNEYNKIIEKMMTDDNPICPQFLIYQEKIPFNYLKNIRNILSNTFLVRDSDINKILDIVYRKIVTFCESFYTMFSQKPENIHRSKIVTVQIPKKVYLYVSDNIDSITNADLKENLLNYLNYYNEIITFEYTSKINNLYI